eukprot:gene12514-6262_t
MYIQSKRKIENNKEEISNKKLKKNELNKEEEEEEEEEYFLSLTDTYLGLELIKNQIKNSVQKINFPAVVPKYILSDVLDKNLKIEKELDVLLKENKIRQFKVELYGKEDLAFIFYDDYIDYIKDIFERKLKERKDLFLKFENEILRKYFDVSIKVIELKNLLKNENEMNTLMKLGLFTLKNENEWWFSIPVAGKFTIQILEGRKEIIKIINRKKFKEILLKHLIKIGLKKSSLPIPFHIRDMLAVGLIKILQTTSGKLISLK